MSLMAPFTPTLPTVSATSGAAASSAGTALPKPFSNAVQRIGNAQVMLTNPSGGTQVIAFIRFGTDNTVQADATDMPILPGDQIVITPPGNSTHFAVFAATATQIYATGGFGE